MLKKTDYIQIILGLIMLLAALGVGFEVGKGYEKSSHAELELARAGAVTERVVSNAETARTQAATNSTIQENYHAETATIGRVRAGPIPDGMRIAARCPSAPRPAQAKSASRSNAPAPAPSVLPADPPVRSDGGASVEVPELAAEQLRGRREEADLVVASCRALQEFTTRNGMAP